MEYEIETQKITNQDRHWSLMRLADIYIGMNWKQLSANEQLVVDLLVDVGYLKKEEAKSVTGEPTVIFKLYPKTPVDVSALLKELDYNVGDVRGRDGTYIIDTIKRCLTI